MYSGLSLTKSAPSIIPLLAFRALEVKSTIETLIPSGIDPTDTLPFGRRYTYM